MDDGAAYACLIYDVFITARFDAMRICIQHCECSWPRKSPFNLFSFGGRVSKICIMFAWMVISVVAGVV